MWLDLVGLACKVDFSFAITSWCYEYGISGELEVEGVDLLSAGVAGEQGDSARAETGPGTGAELVSIQTNFLQVDELFHFAVADA
jgi:hypothetical protein